MLGLIANAAEDNCRGRYLWETTTAPADAAAPATATREQLITQLRVHSSELKRAEEELALLAEERGRCVAFLEQQELSIRIALTSLCVRSIAVLSPDMPVPECSSFGRRQPCNAAQRKEEAMYCDGLQLLLEDRLTACCKQLAAARSAFLASNVTDWDAAATLSAVAAEYESDEEGRMM